MSRTVKIDEIDAKILRMLIKDARTNRTTIARNCGLSANAVHKRLKRLKAAGLITGSILFVNPQPFGLNQSATIGINLDPGQESKVTDLIRKFAYLIHIDRSLGKYDICAFIIAKDMAQIEELKETIRKQQGVRRIAINFWGRAYFNLGNIGLKPKRVKSHG